MFRKAAWDVYVDWQDTSLPSKPDRTTAETIQGRIKAADFFLFLATPNAMASRWCPWEIGYADGVRAADTIFLISTSGDGETHGNEYLDLYRSIDLAENGVLGVWDPGASTNGRRLSAL